MDPETVKNYDCFTNLLTKLLLLQVDRNYNNYLQLI